MADFLTTKERSRLMSRVRRRDTGPEIYVRRTLWGEGFRYRLQVKRLPGTPDLVLSKYRLAVFVHGCFWHQHGCPKSRRPASNREFWDLKLETNKARDVRVRSALKELGWLTVTIWECRLEMDTAYLLSWLKNIRSSS